MKPHEIKKDFSAGGVAWNPELKKVLLIHVSNLSGSQVWTFPKGHPESGESDEEAALREVREETGYHCRVLRKITDVHYTYTHKQIIFEKTVRWFLMLALEKGGSFDPKEVMAIQWASLAEAQALVSYGSDKELLKQTSLLL
ncbi:MAG: Diadenosine hexaphosphate hydrolase [Elusimicrobia bacterium]|nr:Diadenosine hexaphosphate hydrolase [Elusimicrobiota bacterium]